MAARFAKEQKRHIGSLKEYGSMDASARDLAENFDIEKLTPEFYANPYPTYRALREHAPVKRLPNGSYFLTRYDDLVGIYKSTKLFSSDKRREFALREAELVPGFARVAPAWENTVDDGAGFLAGDEIAQLVQAGPKVVGQPTFHFLRHDAVISFRSVANAFLSRAVKSAFSFFA